MRMAQGILRDAKARKSGQRRANGWRIVAIALAAIPAGALTVQALVARPHILDTMLLAAADAFAVRPPAEKHCALAPFEAATREHSVTRSGDSIFFNGTIRGNDLHVSYVVSPDPGSKPKRIWPVHPPRLLGALESDMEKACAGGAPKNPSTRVYGGPGYG